MYVFYRYFHLNHFKTIIFADLSNQLFRSSSNLFSLKYLFTVFRTPYQVVTRIVDRMTRSSQCHVDLISHRHASAYVDKGDAPLTLITPSARHAFIPRGKPRGTLQREY